ncbi:MAG: tyrosine-type recombinase/integrase [Pseudomonadales bacterium]
MTRLNLTFASFIRFSPKVVPLSRARSTSKSGVSETVPNRRANDALRTRFHLTEPEVTKLLKAAKQGRYGQRDHLMVLMAFRHGLRVSELCDLQWSDIDFKAGTVHVRRLKGSKDSRAVGRIRVQRSLRIIVTCTTQLWRYS